jgi:hypothetical protein
VSEQGEPLKVDPTELVLAADQLDGQAAGFSTAHRSAQSRASHAALGAGSSAAALPGMLAAWDSDGSRYDRQFTSLAEKHRAAAAKYVEADKQESDDIDIAGSAL